MRQRKLKRQLEEIIKDTWDGKLFADEWDDWPLMQEAMQVMESKIDFHAIEKLKHKQAEYLALQNQINPHFLYNTLEAIRSDALCEGAQDIADTTKALSTFFRYTITEVGYEVTLEDEINNVDNYFKIQKYRFGDRLEMKVSLPIETSRILMAKIPKLTLQPLVENAISHGLTQKIGKGTVAIKVEEDGENLYIWIKDDGVGIEPEEVYKINQGFQVMKSEEKGSIAMNNVNSRIQLLFGSNYGLRIYSIPDLGTSVQVTLPLTIAREDGI